MHENPSREGRRTSYSGLTVDDLPPPKPRATPTAAPAAIATMITIFAVSLCWGRGGGWVAVGGGSGGGGCFWSGADLGSCI